MQIGDKAPAVLGMDQNGNEVKLADFAGKKLVLYFYPKDSTPGCTQEACNLRDNYTELLDQGYAVVGVSVDSDKSHRRFIEKNSLPFPLIADTGHRLVEEMGVWGEKKMAGRTYMGTYRTTFIISETGVIERIITHKEIKVKDHAAQILS
ncbi:MAG: thioredoxin-dependent thiol peroxidase [Muribaculaceae bacterium]